MQQKEDTNAKIKVVFINNFTKYIEWPADYKEGKFTITVIGGISNSVFLELTKMAEVKKSATNQAFEIKSVTGSGSITRTHIVFVPAESSGQLNDVIGKVKGNSTLIVTERPGLAKQGSIINFIVKDNRQKFELNNNNAKKYSLKVSSNLSDLAILVE